MTSFEAFWSGVGLLALGMVIVGLMLHRLGR